MQLHLIISVLLLLQVPTVNRSVVVMDGLSASPITASAKLTDDHAQLDHLVPLSVTFSIAMMRACVLAKKQWDLLEL